LSASAGESRRGRGGRAHEDGKVLGRAGRVTRALTTAGTAAQDLAQVHDVIPTGIGTLIATDNNISM
jgi:hypothetical protein